MTPPEFAHTGGQLVIRSEKILHYNHVYDCEFETEILLLLFIIQIYKQNEILYHSLTITFLFSKERELQLY